jgi:hypothetical protein
VGSCCSVTDILEKKSHRDNVTTESALSSEKGCDGFNDTIIFFSLRIKEHQEKSSLWWITAWCSSPESYALCCLRNSGSLPFCMCRWQRGINVLRVLNTNYSAVFKALCMRKGYRVPKRVPGKVAGWENSLIEQKLGRLQRGFGLKNIYNCKVYSRKKCEIWSKRGKS